MKFSCSQESPQSATTDVTRARTTDVRRTTASFRFSRTRSADDLSHLANSRGDRCSASSTDLPVQLQGYPGQRDIGASYRGYTGSAYREDSTQSQAREGEDVDVLKAITVRWMNGESEVFEGEWETVLQVKMHLIERRVEEVRFLTDIAVLDPTDYEMLSDDDRVLPMMTVVLKELRTRDNLQDWKEDIVLHYKAEGVRGLKRIGRQVERDGRIDVADVFERQRGFRVFIALQNKDPNRLCELVGYESHINLLAIYTLVAAKGDPNADIGGSVLMHAIHESNLPAVDFLIEHRTDVNMAGSHWCSESSLPLHTATNLAAFSSGDVRIIRSLLDAKASVNAKSSNGKTVIQHFLENSRWFLCFKKTTNRRPTQVAEVLQQALESGETQTPSRSPKVGADDTQPSDVRGTSRQYTDVDIEPWAGVSRDDPWPTSARSSMHLSDRDDLGKACDYSRRSSVTEDWVSRHASRTTSRRTSLYATEMDGRKQDDIFNRLHLLDRRITERRDSELQSYYSVEHAQEHSLVDHELLARLQDLHRRIGERDTEIRRHGSDASRRSSVERHPSSSRGTYDCERHTMMRHLLQRTVVEDGLGFPLESEGRCTLERARNEVAMVLQQALETSASVFEEALEKTKPAEEASFSRWSSGEVPDTLGKPDE